jgi:hypothetical protein
MENQEKKYIDKHDLVGKTFGKWTVVEYLRKSKYKAVCACGFEAIKQTCEIMNHKSSQCIRCRKKEMKTKHISTTFGYTSSDFYGEL